MKDFKKLRKLGDGAYGDVYLVQKKDNEKIYALKLIDKNFLAKLKKEHHVY